MVENERALVGSGELSSGPEKALFTYLACPRTASSEPARVQFLIRMCPDFFDPNVNEHQCHTH